MEASICQVMAHQVRECQEYKEYHRDLRYVEITPWPWSRLLVEIGGLFQSHHFLEVVSTFAKCVEFLWATTPSAGEPVLPLRQGFPAQGLPDVMASDDGPTLASKEYIGIFTMSVIKSVMIPLYYPAPNGAAERLIPP